MRAQLAERKQELLEYLQYAQPAEVSTPTQEGPEKCENPPLEKGGRGDFSSRTRAIPPIGRRLAGTPAPLSFAQERLWFLEQLDPGNAAYNVCRAWRISGKLKVAALEASLNEIVRRHEVLRSEIRGGKTGDWGRGTGDEDGKTGRLGEKEKTKKWQAKWVSLGRRKATEDDFQRVIQKEALRAFDFSKGKFLRASLARLADQEHVLVLTTHHIVSDAWSMGILSRELWALYEAFANKKPSPLADLPIQYSDFAVWQRNWLQGQVLDEQLAYWKKQLKDVSPLNLPTDRPRLARQTFAGSRVTLSLPESLTRAIDDLSLRFNVTPFMTLLAAFQILLYRYTGQEDIAVGSPIANRSRSELEALIGFFVNTLVLRSNLSGAPSFKELLTQVRDLCLGAYAHQDLPFEKLVQELKPERDASRNPLFQAMFVLQNATRPLSEVPGLRIEPVEIESTRSQFDLSLFLRERDGRFIGFIEYNTDLFKRDRIERMVGHFQVLLEGIVADPEQSVATLPILTERERQQILIEWNDTAADYPKDKCIHQLFEEQVERTPDAIAIAWKEQQLTYRELNIRANQLAYHLIELGVGPEKLVGICVERSIDMVVGLLGILKAGGAYVPLDPAYPPERLRFMLDDSGADGLVTEKQCLVRLNESDASGGGDPAIQNQKSKIKNVFLVDRDWPEIAQQSDRNPASRVRSENLAYVIYTSGSTGKPKGVAIEHRNAMNLLNWARGVYSAEELAGVLAGTSICFDLSVFELFLPLTTGGKVILAENALHLHKAAANHEVTLVNTVPSVMAQMLALGPMPKSVRTVNLAGEPLKAELVNRLYEKAGVDKVYDLYGPTETTTYTTFTLRRQNGPETIGRPIANTQIYILDVALQPVLVGVEGELYIGGDGVTRGYLNRADLTEERFVRNSFNDESNASPFEKGGLRGISSAARIYHTGDRARYCPDGNVEYLGRTDNQVKIRGFRIELGEIEATLSQHPAVKESVIVARDRGSSEEKQLVAYVLPSDASSASATELRSFLREKLPDYMLPVAFMIVDALPQMPNGKVDRKSLPSPDGVRVKSEREFVAPGTDIEDLVAQAWRKVLNIENLSIYDNFFDLGGHSLLGLQIVGRLRETFNREIPLRALFDAPTVADLSTEIDHLLRHGLAPTLPPIVPVLRDGRPIPLTMNQEHLWRLEQMMPGTPFSNMPYVYELSGRLDVRALEESLRQLVQRHEVLRTVFDELDGKPVQIINAAADLELTIVDLQKHEAETLLDKATSLIWEQRVLPFDLKRGPLLRTTLVELTKNERLLLVTVHHIIADHWSMRIFREELLALYEINSSTQLKCLPDPKLQFADYAVWERSCLKNGFFDNHLQFWKDVLVDPHPSQTCFNPSNKPTNDTSRRDSITIESPLLDAINRVAEQEKSSVYMVLLAAVIFTLQALTRSESIRVGTFVANRRPETEHTMGHFANTVVICVHRVTTLTPRDLLCKVREACLSMHGYQDIPLQEVLSDYESTSKLKRASMFRILFDYQRRDIRPRMVGALTLAPFDLNGDTGPIAAPSTFDLIVRARLAKHGLALALEINRGPSSGAHTSDHLTSGIVKFVETLCQ